MSDTNQGAATDPAIDPVALAQDRAEQLVNNLATQALSEIGNLRDKCDNLMHSIKARQGTLTDEISTFASFIADVIASKVIIADQVSQLEKKFQPLLGPTLTQQPGNGK